MLDVVVKDMVKQLSTNIDAGVENYIKECMDKAGITEDELSCYVLEWYPVEIDYNNVNGRLRATQTVRLRHKTDEELAQEKE